MAPAFLDVSGLSCRRGGRRVFEGLSFGLGAGELLTLTGPNGSGKTTLLRTLALLVPFDAGTIQWQGADVTADREAWRKRLGWLGHQEGLKADLSVRENISIACRLRGESIHQNRIDEALAAFDLVRLSHRPARTLSAGQRRRAALARLVAGEAQVWLLDEPFNALDASSQAALRDVMETHIEDGGLAIAATHVSLGLRGARTLELGPLERGQ